MGMKNVKGWKAWGVPYRRPLGIVLALVYAGWMGYLIFWLLVLSFAGVAMLNGVAIALALVAWVAVPLFAYGAVRLERVPWPRAGGLAARLRGRKFKAALLVAAAVVVPLGIAAPTFGLALAVGVALMSAILLLSCAFGSSSRNAAFSVLTLFVLSIVAVNVLALNFAAFTATVHALVFVPTLWLQRDALRSDPVRLQRLVRWGVGASIVLVAVHAVVLAAELGRLDLGGLISGALPEILWFFGATEGNPLYFGYPISLTLLSAGVLLMLSTRVPKWVSMPVVALGLAGSYGWYSAALPLISASGLEWELLLE